MPPPLFPETSTRSVRHTRPVTALRPAARPAALRAPFGWPGALESGLQARPQRSGFELRRSQSGDRATDWKSAGVNRPIKSALVGPRAGISAAASSVGLGLVGSLVLHPDFGMDKTNKTIRFAHKTGARATLFLAWVAAFSGLYKMTQDAMMLILFAGPLLVFVPFVLM